MRALLPLVLLISTVRATELGARIDALAKPYVDGKQVVGMVVGVIPGRGKAPLLRSYGRLTAGKERAPDGDTVYEIGSFSKVFTGVLLASLVQQGKLRLDQPLRELLPVNVSVPRRGKLDMTLLHLSTHTSSLPRMPDNFLPRDPANPFADYSVGQLYDFLSTHELRRDVGARYEYSNLAVGLLGHVMARKTAKTYEQLLVETIAAPLGMKSTRIGLTDDMRRRLAPGHNAAGARVKNWDIPTLAGAGGIRSTVNDMLRFLQANLDGGDTPLARALATARKLHYQPPNEKAHALGLGWHIGPQTKARWHNGQTGGYHSIAAVDTKTNTAVVVLSNSATMVVDQFGAAVALMLREKP